MSSYIQQLRQSKDKATVAFQEFALSTKAYSNHLFCFFEGKDNPYYVPRIKSFTETIFPINCGGRDKVLRVFELISKQDVYNKYSKAFFIDRDFNNPLQNNRDIIFETPCYSIENLYVNINVFEQILIHDFQFSRNDTNFEVCISLFNERFKEFNSSVSLFNSWYACLIEIRNQSGKQTGVQLDEKLPKGLVNISLQNVASNYDFASIKQIFPESTDIDEETLNNKVREFKNCDSELIFRGKYQLEFLIALLQLIINDSKFEQHYIKSKINYSFDSVLNHKRALTLFTNYASTPESLNKFLHDITTKN
ncbi:MAG: DUF4435 domain-containing protein [Chitinophagales bacterium]|nr:DUF4435 domain-containing protein [Chitinophagales bacterium]